MKECVTASIVPESLGQILSLRHRLNLCQQLPSGPLIIRYYLASRPNIHNCRCAPQWFNPDLRFNMALIKWLTMQHESNAGYYSVNSIVILSAVVGALSFLVGVRRKKPHNLRVFKVTNNAVVQVLEDAHKEVCQTNGFSQEPRLIDWY